MTTANPITRRKIEAGYTLLMVVFMVATMMILALAVTTNVATDGRREKEAEMVWRGEQYERAIGLYQRKFNNKYPTKIEDLTKQTNGVRFLRQAYKDPMNSADGSWRFIYITPSGQIVGSLRPTSLLPVPTLQGPTASPFGGPSQGLPQLGGIQQQTPFGGAAQQQLVTATTANTGSQDSQPQPLAGAVLGGSIIGIGSKIKKPSLRVYMGGDNYQQWEFIYSPNGQLIIPGQAPVTPNGITGAPGIAPGGTNQNGTPGATPNGNGVGPNGNGQNGSSPPVPPNPPDPNNPSGQPQQPPPNQ